MTLNLTMPALSPTMEKGNLAKWLVAVGDRVKIGDVLAEIETDKATMEYEAEAEGVISEIVIHQGTDDVAVGSILAILDIATKAISSGLTGTQKLDATLTWQGWLVVAFNISDVVHWSVGPPAWWQAAAEPSSSCPSLEVKMTASGRVPAAATRSNRLNRLGSVLQPYQRTFPLADRMGKCTPFKVS